MMTFRFLLVRQIDYRAACACLVECHLIHTSIVAVLVILEDWPYDPRLPQGISFADGAFTGTATDTQDNEGRLWYNNVSTVNRTVEGNPVSRLRPVWNLPLKIRKQVL